MVLNEIERVERLLKQLLLHSGPVPLDSSRFNIHELLNTVIQFEKNSIPGIKFKRIYDTSLPEINSDRDKLHQIFLNLLSYARLPFHQPLDIFSPSAYCFSLSSVFFDSGYSLLY